MTANGLVFPLFNKEVFWLFRRSSVQSVKSRLILFSLFPGRPGEPPGWRPNSTKITFEAR